MVNAAARELKENTAVQISITFCALNFAASNGVMGAVKATMSAKRLTTQPASATLTLNSSAIIGITPIAPSSVVKIENTPNIRLGINKICVFVIIVPYLTNFASIF